MSEFTTEQEQFIKQLLGATDGGTVIWTETTTAPDGTVTERKAEIAAPSKEAKVPELPKPEKKKKKKVRCYICEFKSRKYQLYEDERTRKRYPVCYDCIDENGGGTITIRREVPIVQRQTSIKYNLVGDPVYASDKENYTRCPPGQCEPNRKNLITGALHVVLGTGVDRSR